MCDFRYKPRCLKPPAWVDSPGNTGVSSVLDEPSSLPEGTEVELIPADDIEELDAEERARLHGFLAASIRKHAPGTGVPADEVLARLQAKH
jgi:hypothetical protein